MALDFFEIGKGLNINGNVLVLEGSGIPGGTTDTDNAPVSSVYLDYTNGKLYWKNTSGAGTDKWGAGADEAYVQSQVGTSVSWREPVEVRDNVSLTTPAAATNTVDGVTIYDGMRALFSALTVTADRNVWVASGSTGAWTWTEDANAESSGDTVYVISGTDSGKRFTYNGTNWVQTDGTTQDELGYIRSFIGKNASGSETPSYSSITQITQSADLETTIGELDAAIGTDPTNGETILAANTVNANVKALDNFFAKHDHETTATNVTTAVVVDQIAVTNYVSAKWLVFATDNATGLKLRASEIHALCNGTTVDATEYGVNKIGSAIAGLSWDVAFSGGNLQLKVSSTTAVNVEAKRVSVIDG